MQKKLDGLRGRYEGLLARCLGRRRAFALGFVVFCLASLGLFAVAGRDFFPSVDTGEIRLHLRAQTGTRIEETARITDEVEQRIRSLVPRSQLASILDNIGLPVSGINLTYDSSSPIGSADADILVTLTPQHAPTPQYVKELRTTLNREFPGVTFAFLPADIIGQILNFGLPSPIDIQIVGNDVAGNRQWPRILMRQLHRIQGLVDLRIQQPDDAPAHQYGGRSGEGDAGRLPTERYSPEPADRTVRKRPDHPQLLAESEKQCELSAHDAKRRSIRSTRCRRWPIYRWLLTAANGPMAPVKAWRNRYCGSETDSGSVSTWRAHHRTLSCSHYNVQPVIDIFGTTSRVATSEVLPRTSIASSRAAQAHLPAGSSLVVRGQIATMRASFAGLESGIAMAIVLVYLLMVINFQSWVDPLIILSGLPGAMAGIVAAVPDWNHGQRPRAHRCNHVHRCGHGQQILLVTFARERLAAGVEYPAGGSRRRRAGRFRPVLMTALAMLIGMLPMALGLGDGGEQNAPLGRAVIGGLLFGTVTTLLFVPVVFSAVHSMLQRRGFSMAETQHV